MDAVIVIYLIIGYSLSIFMWGVKTEQKSFFKGETTYLLIEYTNGKREWIDDITTINEPHTVITRINTLNQK